MLLFQDPIWLWGVPAVAVAAAWALFRPQRRLAVVGSLELWQAAVEHLDRSQRLRTRRVSLSWLLLLAGALAAVAAAARPALLSSAPARNVAVALYPSAEIASKKGMDGLRQAADELLARLSPGDQVQLLLPEGAPSPSGWMSVDAARRRAADLLPLPVPAADLSLAAPDRAARHVYRIAPAGSLALRVPGGSTGLAVGETLIEVPTTLPDVTLDALAAETLSDGNVQAFLRLHNHLSQPWQGSYLISPRQHAPAEPPENPRTQVLLPPGATAFVETTLAQPALAVEILSAFHAGKTTPQESHGPWDGFLVRRETAAVKVAFVGDDDPLIRRFVTINPDLSLVENPAGADVLVCVGRDPPSGADAPGAGMPALVIHPPTPPPLCRPAGGLANLVLGEAGLTADSQDPVMRNVDLSAVAVRSASPWTLEGAADLKVLCGIKGAALIVRTAPERQAAEAGGKRRIYLAFATDTENTNFATTESFVIFLANAMGWLAEDARGARPGPTASPASAPAPPGRARYEYVSPLQAAFTGDWKRLAPQAAPDGPAWAKGPYPPPGLYQDGRGNLHSVSLVGLRSAVPKTPPAQVVAAALLPLAQPTGISFELRAWLALAAIGLWLAGWAARLR
jgi:hypothetical protein